MSRANKILEVFPGEQNILDDVTVVKEAVSPVGTSSIEALAAFQPLGAVGGKVVGSVRFRIRGSSRTQLMDVFEKIYPSGDEARKDLASIMKKLRFK